MVNRYSLKQEARDIVHSSQVNPYIFSFLYILILNIFSVIDSYVSSDISYALELLDLPVPAILTHPEYPALIVTFIGIMSYLLNVILSAGYDIYQLGVNRGHYMTYTSLFDGFTNVGKFVVLSLLQRLIIGLLTVLFIFPGFIFAYRYRFTVYNLCEDPSIGVIDAMRRSAIQTNGYKWSLFMLDLSFLGWHLLGFLTFGLLQIWLLPYIEQTNVCYYREICSLTRARFPQSGNDPTDSHFDN